MVVKEVGGVAHPEAEFFVGTQRGRVSDLGADDEAFPLGPAMFDGKADHRGSNAFALMRHGDGNEVDDEFTLTIEQLKEADGNVCGIARNDHVLATFSSEEIARPSSLDLVGMLIRDLRVEVEAGVEEAFACDGLD